MNIILDKLPEVIEIDGKQYDINSDFRVIILFYELLQDRNIPIGEKIIHALKLFYKEIPNDLAEAVNKLFWFIRCGRELDEEKELGEVKDRPRTTPTYDYCHDANLFFSAFLQQYNINLQTDKLHWWEFQALFEGLAECKLIEVMNIRGIKITNDMNPSEKSYYRRMKEIYTLPDNRTTEEIEQDFNDTISSLF